MFSEEVEEWRDIGGYEGRYQVSNLGRVRSLSDNHGRPLIEPKIRKFKVGHKGHLSLDLHNGVKVEWKLVHRLVLEAFVGPCPIDHECCHYDNNPQNNRVENLRWGSRACDLAREYSLPKHIPGEIKRGGAWSWLEV